MKSRNPRNTGSTAQKIPSIGHRIDNHAKCECHHGKEEAARSKYRPTDEITNYHGHDTPDGYGDQGFRKNGGDTLTGGEKGSRVSSHSKEALEPEIDLSPVAHGKIEANHEDREDSYENDSAKKGRGHDSKQWWKNRYDYDKYDPPGELSHALTP